MSASSPRRKALGKTEERPAAGEAPTDEESASKWERVATARAASVEPVRQTPSRPRIRKRGENDRVARAGSDETGAEAKPIRYLVQNLERAYGTPVNRRAPRATDPLDMLVKIILSQATSDVNSDRTFAALKRRFPVWDAVLRARERTLADTIRSGGLADQKTNVIREVLRRIKDERGTLTLNFLHDAPAAEAVRYLSAFRGIGPKTVACTLLFACHKNVFPLDTHIFRVLRRVGLIPRKCSDARAHEIMNRVVPEGKFYSFHVNLIRHGRKICRPREPLCGQCPIVEYCDYGQEKI